MKSNPNDSYGLLREKYSYFIYEGFSYALNNSKLYIVFDFNLAGEFCFRPEICLPLPEKFQDNILSDSLIRNIIFNMGMIELISYWKAACPPRLIVKPMGLSTPQTEWWKKLYRNGLGEFFYENGISPDDDFMKIESDGGPELTKHAFDGSEEVLVPIGGGKDSVVTLELLSRIRKCRPFIINPREASILTTGNAGYQDNEVIKLSRSIDPKLIELNAAGFLNGHTPFSAMLAFTSVLVAAVYGIGEVALSNESSANEPTIPGTNINHQYSKSLGFEEDFREYISSYVTSGINYYSYLRPLNELQITGMFARFPQHFSSFKSCNVGSKTDTWCGECPKCLFTYIMLSVYLKKGQLLKIFGSDLFEKESLLYSFDQLCGLADEKPFECVGTLDEVNAAVKDIIKNYSDKALPLILQHYKDSPAFDGEKPDALAGMLKEFEPHHIPGEDGVLLLKNMIDAF